MGHVGESYIMAFNSGLVDEIYQRQEEENLMLDPIAVMGGKDGGSGGYMDIDSDGN